ncbi:penicillin-binding protein 1A [Ramlibacter sp.]|uniref:penicillin-binding protein 1A n=1 Tax=Ramlibacter sp. TaxID=1917967 RepID=UPI002B9B0446|nr:transglycosylase domain-containing protein [Ramlibacter sp.]HWI81325.1 transglycosylase domain-containing protein [Ramlibacter sp.]
MIPAVRRAADVALEQLGRLRDLVRRHPVRAALAPPALLLLYILILIPLTPGTADLRKAKSELPTQVMSAEGVVLAVFKRVNREWVPLNRISPHVVNALIATEDHRFYEHHGIDLRRTGAALLSTLGGERQGGSTITQQLARNLYPDEIGRAASLHRKAKEAVTALKIEAVYTKSEILETYLNTVPFLYNAFGIEMAARTYFDKSARQLDVLESATLIGMLKGTSYYNPVLNPERALDRRNIVLAQMAKRGKLDPARLAGLQKRPLRVDFERQPEPLGPAPHVARIVRQWLIGWADRNGYNIYADGLVVRTTVSMRLQKAANQAVARQTAQLQALANGRTRRGEEAPVLQAGFLAVDPRTGQVKAWVGSRDFDQEQFDHVSQARRQPGSTFKPFVYGAAFAAGFSPAMTFVDEPVSFASGGEVWTPGDVAPPTHQPMTLRDGLVHSKNTITAQLMDKIGPVKVAQLARALGVRQSKLELVPSLALGTSPVTLREMVAAYGSIANGGEYIEPQLVVRVEDREGRTLEGFIARQPERAMPRASALTLVNVMRGVVDEGTGVAIRQRYGISADVAGKTGTTQDNSDGWFILMHPQLVAGAWVGFNDNRVAMGPWGQGARSALPIVADVFQQSLRARWIDPRVEFDIPRPRPRPPPEPAQPGRVHDPVMDLVTDIFRGILKQLQ